MHLIPGVLIFKKHLIGNFVLYHTVSSFFAMMYYMIIHIRFLQENNSVVCKVDFKEVNLMLKWHISTFLQVEGCFSDHQF